VATTADQVQALRPYWEQLPWRSIDAQLDYFLAATASRPTVVRPHVLVALRDERPEAMLLARVEHIRALPGSGLTGRLPTVRAAVLAPGGLIGGRDACHRLMRGLTRLMRDGEVEAVCLRTVVPGDDDHRALQAAVPSLLRAPPLRADPHWFIDLPGSYEAYKAGLSRNLRRARAREARALERRYPGGVEMVRFPGPEPTERLLEDIEAIARRSYQRGRRVGYDPVEHAPLVRSLMPLGHCRAWVLRVEGRPVAFELGWPFAGTYFGAFTAYDSDLRAQGVGGQVEQAALADLCEDASLSVYDQGVEDYAYKRRLSNRCVLDARVWAFAPRPKPLTYLALRTAYEVARLLRTRAARARG
jgi:hypothetical protein